MLIIIIFRLLNFFVIISFEPLHISAVVFDSEWNKIHSPTNIKATLFFFVGNVWVFSSYGDLSTDPASGKYCHPIAYNFAFWYIIVMYSLCVVFILLVGCCFCAAACTFACTEREEATQNNTQLSVITGGNITCNTGFNQGQWLFVTKLNTMYNFIHFCMSFRVAQCSWVDYNM